MAPVLPWQGKYFTVCMWICGLGLLLRIVLMMCVGFRGGRRALGGREVDQRNDKKTHHSSHGKLKCLAPLNNMLGFNKLRLQYEQCAVYIWRSSRTQVETKSGGRHRRL